MWHRDYNITIMTFALFALFANPDFTNMTFALFALFANPDSIIMDNQHYLYYQKPRTPKVREMLKVHESDIETTKSAKSAKVR